MSKQKMKLKDIKVEDLREEIYTVEITRYVPSGVAMEEVWRNNGRKVHRPIQDGPAIIRREIDTGESIGGDEYIVNNQVVDPKDVERQLASRPPHITPWMRTEKRTPR